MASLLALFTSTMFSWAIDIQSVKSSRELTAWLVEDYTLPIIAVSFSFEGGTTQDEIGKEGGVRLMTSLFDEGAGELNNVEFQSLAEEKGVNIRFSAATDDLYGGMSFIRSEMETATLLAKIALSKPRFDEPAIERMRDGIVKGLERQTTSPGALLGERFRKVFYQSHPYSRPGAGTIESVKALSRHDLVKLHSRLIAREKLHIGIVGAISAKEAAILIDDIFGELPAKPQLREVPEAEPNFGTTEKIEFNSPNSILLLAYPGMKREDPNFFAAHLLNHVLGGGTFSSRLYNEIREKRGLSYGVSSNLATFDHAAYLSASTSTRAENTQKALDIMKSEVARVAKDGITAEELEAAKKYVAGSYAINNLDSSGNIARVLASLQRLDLGIDYIESRQEEIKNVTLEKANPIARKLLSKAPTVVVVGP